MPTFLAELLTQMRAIWARLDSGQRLLMGSMLVLTGVGLGAMLWYAGRPDYQMVFEAQDPRETSAAVSALSRASIPFRRDGRGILVPRSRDAEANSVLYQAGLTAGSSSGGAEPDGALTQMTLDRAARKDLLDAKNRARAERAVLQIDGVLGATVTASKPTRSVFQALDADAESRASVLLRLRLGANFRSVAAASVDTVAAALAIHPRQVVVRNAVTQERYSMDPDRGGLDSGDFLAQQRTRSRELTERAQAILDGIYPNQARVQVTADLDPNWEMRQEKIVPPEPILVSDRTTKRDTQDGASITGGDPSSASQPAGSGDGTRTSSKDSTSEKNYEPFAGTANRGKLAPEVRKLTVALVIDEKLQLPAEKITNVENLVKQCVGWDSDRDAAGFAVHVEKFPEITDLPEVATGPGTMDMVREWAPTAAQVIGVVLVLLFLRSLLGKAQVATSSRRKAELDPEEEAVDESTLSPEEKTRKLRRDIEEAIQKDPSAVSRMLESWLTEVEA